MNPMDAIRWARWLDDARLWIAPGRSGSWLAGISKVTDELPESARIWKVVGVIRSAGESAINPLGKVPVVVLDSGEALERFSGVSSMRLLGAVERAGGRDQT